MTDGPHLPGKNALVAHFCRAGEAHLAAEEGIFANFRGVTHEHEVVNFCATPDAGFTDGGAIHTRVRLNLDIVFDHNGAGLKDLVPAAAGLAGEAETVSSNDDAVLQNDAVADNAGFAPRKQQPPLDEPRESIWAAGRTAQWRAQTKDKYSPSAAPPGAERREGAGGRRLPPTGWPTRGWSRPDRKST